MAKESKRVAAMREKIDRTVQYAIEEGLALLNGTQVSTALALAAVFRTENLMAAVMMAGAMSSDAIKGSDTF